MASCIHPSNGLLKGRLQNRIAQRNHRTQEAPNDQARASTHIGGRLGRRLKEQSSIASSEDSSDPHDHQDPSTLPSHQGTDLAAPDVLRTGSPLSPSGLMDAIMADDMSLRSTTPWPALDTTMAPMPGANALPSKPDSFFFPLSQGCTCNGVTGPCGRHLEEIRFQVLNTAMTTSPASLPPSVKRRAGSAPYDGGAAISAGPFGGGSPGDIDAAQQPPGLLHHRPDYQSLSLSTSTPAPK